MLMFYVLETQYIPWLFVTSPWTHNKTCCSGPDIHPPMKRSNLHLHFTPTGVNLRNNNIFIIFSEYGKLTYNY